MFAFLEDESRYDAFLGPLGVGDSPNEPEHQGDDLHLNIIECFQGDLEGRIAVENTVSGLARRRKAALRVIFAPIDVPKASNWSGLVKLFVHLDVPSSFLSERIQSVCCSFGAAPRQNGDHALWFHFLCKNVQLDSNNNIRNTSSREDGAKLSQGDWSWHKAGFFIRWHDNLLDFGSQNGTLASDCASTPRFDDVTCCCFGAPQALLQRFVDVVGSPRWVDVLQDPFALVDIILDELFLLLDKQKNNLRAAFGQVETRTLLQAAQQSSKPANFDFVGLSNLLKHNLNLGTDSALETVEAARKHHTRYFERYPSVKQNRMVHAIEDAFDHKCILFKSIHLQALSREKRMEKLTELAFNLVVQQSNRTMIHESRSMRTIAIISLVFLPFASIAALFSTPFFSNSPDSQVWISRDFWIFWVVVIPLTFVICGAWIFYHIRPSVTSLHTVLKDWTSFKQRTKSRNEDIELMRR